MDKNVFINLLEGRHYRIIVKRRPFDNGIEDIQPIREWLTKKEAISFILTISLEHGSWHIQKYKHGTWHYIII